MSPSQKFGVWLMGIGADLAFNKRDDETFDALKDAINRETDIGSHIESGGHIHTVVQPISRYTAISVVNVLCNTSIASKDNKVSYPDDTMPQYVEHWGNPKEN